MSANIGIGPLVSNDARALGHATTVDGIMLCRYSDIHSETLDSQEIVLFESQDPRWPNGPRWSEVG